jgi:type I restriction enzyme S subunit
MRFLLEEAEKYTAVKGDVLICEGGYPGRAAIWDRDEPIYFQKALHRVRFHEPERNKWFVYYLQFRDLEGTLRKHFNGAGIQHFTGEALARFELPVPPLAEQQRIVGVLDEAFANLATAQAHASQNLQNAHELFESHLNAVFTQRGEGWQLRRIPDVCVTFGRGKSRHRPRNEPCLYGGKYPFIQTGDISNADHVITTHTQTYNETGLAQSKLWPKGTVGIAIVGATIGETGVLDFEACFPDSVIGMTVNPAEADPFFLEYMLQHFKEMVKSHGEGSARENINLATFDRLLFPMPSVKEQRQIAAATDALKDQTKRLESIYQRKLAALDELKKSLLHQAFNGEL